MPIFRLRSAKSRLAVQPSLKPDRLPDLVEGRTIAGADINGVAGGNLVIGDGGDAAIIFRDEVALFQNSVGVYLIGENGEILDPKLAFAAVEHSEEFFDANGNQQHAFIRPGGGQFSPGDQVLLSELYPDQDLPPGTKFGLFLVVDGGNTEAGLTGRTASNFEMPTGSWRPSSTMHRLCSWWMTNVIRQDVFHALDTDSAKRQLEIGSIPAAEAR